MFQGAHSVMRRCARSTTSCRMPPGPLRVKPSIQTWRPHHVERGPSHLSRSRSHRNSHGLRVFANPAGGTSVFAAQRRFSKVRVDRDIDAAAWDTRGRGVKGRLPVGDVRSWLSSGRNRGPRRIHSPRPRRGLPPMGDRFDVAQEFHAAARPTRRVPRRTHNRGPGECLGSRHRSRERAGSLPRHTSLYEPL